MYLHQYESPCTIFKASGCYSRKTYSRSGIRQKSIGCHNFDYIGIEFQSGQTSNAMTHVLVLSAKGRRNEWLWQTLDIGNMFGPTFGFQNSQ